MVYVQSIRGKKLMPCSKTKARHLLKAKRAKIINYEPFTIKLLFKCENKTQPITLGVDTGSKVVGLSATTSKKELFSGEFELRNNIVKLISTRAKLRRSRRSRKTRYRPARFLNRRRTKKKGWLPPSIKNKLNAHVKTIDSAINLLPVTKIILETAKFNIAKINNPEIKDYTSGPQKGFANVRAYILARDNYQCQSCKKKNVKLQVHHIESRKTGGNAPNNLITLCEECHLKYHSGDLKLNFKRGKSFRDATFMSILRKRLPTQLREKYSSIQIEETFGYITKANREKAGLPKEHRYDAWAISNNPNAQLGSEWWKMKQVQKHNRKIHKATPKKGGKRDLEQSPYKTHGYRLYDKIKFNNEIFFIIARRLNGCFTLKNIKTGTLLDKMQKFISFYSVRNNSVLLERRNNQYECS